MAPSSPLLRQPLPNLLTPACHHPWRCLWRGLLQITRTTPWRRITLHFSQRRFTEALTFMAVSHSLVSVGDSSSRQIIRRQLNLHLISRQNTNEIHPDFAGDMSQDLVS